MTTLIDIWVPLSIAFIFIIQSTHVDAQFITNQSPSKRPSENEIKLMTFLAEKMNKPCMRIGVGFDWIGDQPRVVLQDDIIGRSILRNFNFGLGSISPVNRFVLALLEPPSQELLNAIMPKIFTERFFIVFCKNKEVLASFLLSKAMSDEENVVAILLKNGAYEVFIRQMFTEMGAPLIKKVMIWRPGTKMKNETEIYPEQMKNLHGAKLEVSSLRYLPEAILTQSRRIWSSKCAWLDAVNCRSDSSRSSSILGSITGGTVFPFLTKFRKIAA